MRTSMYALSLFFTGALWAGTALAADLTDVDQIVDQANHAAYYQGEDGRSEVRMVIRDDQGREQLRQFTILRKDLADGGDQNFYVAFSRPADVRNTVFMVAKHVDRDDDRWLYLPGLDLVKRISAGDKRTSFVGSHFFYEDVSGRNPAEDRFELMETTAEQYHLKATPKDPQSVEFSQYQLWIDKATMLPVRIDYFDSGAEPYRRVEALEIQDIQGFPTVVTSRVSDLRGGGATTMEFGFMKYDIGLPDEVFSERSLRTLPRDWLRRPQ
ncbi:outer membrane lipoprotein-sorting protein [Marinobacterium sp. D7]|uniref:outer membrane lipoprotein-sorting protein n=1 Tax=Marinobacterium ramblicola TaxID=2849041 RepID=UPI001C2DA4A3|nr:outer membrane lipoprotein-sorting protein [Marinobacterium ramblicola]MBV1786475.1 outer membrane lipoprotein-sorting protein [Marinobacterium ramblicola]